MALTQHEPELARRALTESDLLKRLEDDARSGDVAASASAAELQDKVLIELFGAGGDAERISRLPLHSFLRIV